MSVDKWNDRYAQSELVWSATPNMFVERLLSDAEPGTALDLAAGEGRNSIWLASRGWTVTAVDFSDVAIDKATRVAERAGVTIDTVVADLTEWVPQPDTFDLVLVNYLQLEATDLDPIIARAGAAVAPGGMFLWVSHDVSNLDGGYGGPPNPAVLTSPDQVVAALDTDFEIETAEVAERAVATDDGPRTALDTLVVASRLGGDTR